MKTSQSQIRARLESERTRLNAELQQFSSQSGEERGEGSPFGKREEKATETLELEKRLVMERSTRDQLARVEHALSKIEKGTYGRCDSCGQPIDPARLEALPEANLCMKCKAQQAKDGKGRLGAV